MSTVPSTTNTNTKDESHVSFIVTGFGPFQNSKVNPTTVIANQLPDHLRDKQEYSKVRLQTTFVIETSAEAAQLETDRLRESLIQHQNENRNSIVVLLHLGVNYMGTHFQLEQCAYNEANFGIPDERGFQPRNEKVLDNATNCCNSVLTTHLNVEKIHADLKESLRVNGTANDSAFVISTDPGRFVCNYTYYCSLSKLNECPNIYTLFLHVPPFAVVPQEKQLQLILLLMETIQKQLKPLDENC